MYGESGLDFADTGICEFPLRGGREEGLYRDQTEHWKMEIFSWHSGSKEWEPGNTVWLGKRLCPVSEREEQDDSRVPAGLLVPLPRRLKFKAVLQQEQAPELGSGSQAEAKAWGRLLC